MMSALRIVAFAAACLCGRVMAAESFEGLPELEARDEIVRQAEALYRARDFNTLDARSEAYIANATRTSSGLWVSGLFESGVENAIVQPRPPSDSAWDQVEQGVEAWAKQRPQSALAHLMMAETISNRAWSIRGGGYAHTVALEAWEPFRAHLARARDYLIANVEVTSRHPQYYVLLVTIDNALGLEGAPIQKDFEDGLRRHPGYYPLYFAMLNHLMPKWHGGPKQIEAFARDAVERSRETEGKSMYARIYWFAAQNGYEDMLFLSSYARWDSMRAGFEDVIARYPDQWNLQNYAHFACEADDTATLKKLLPRVQTPIDQAWTGRASFETCRQLAGYSKT